MVEEYNTSLDLYEKSSPSDKDLAKMLNELATFLYLNARYEGAGPLYRRALEIHEKVLGPEHPKTVTIRNNLESLGV